MKEEIIIEKQRAAATNKFTFVMKHPRLSMHVLADGSLGLQEELEEEQTGEASDEEIVFYLDAPILFDQNGEILRQITRSKKEMEFLKSRLKWMRHGSWMKTELILSRLIRQFALRKADNH